MELLEERGAKVYYQDPLVPVIPPVGRKPKAFSIHQHSVQQFRPGFHLSERCFHFRRRVVGNDVVVGVKPDGSLSIAPLYSRVPAGSCGLVGGLAKSD